MKILDFRRQEEGAGVMVNRNHWRFIHENGFGLLEQCIALGLIGDTKGLRNQAIVFRMTPPCAIVTVFRSEEFQEIDGVGVYTPVHSGGERTWHFKLIQDYRYWCVYNHRKHSPR